LYTHANTTIQQGDVKEKVHAPHASASRPHHMLVVVEHPREELAIVPTTVLLRRAEVTGLIGNGQLAVVWDAEFDSWDRVEVILIRRTNLVDVLPLGVAPTVRRVLHERLIETAAIDLWNEAKSAVE